VFYNFNHHKDIYTIANLKIQKFDNNVFFFFFINNKTQSVQKISTKSSFAKITYRIEINLTI
jgi:hypothetical protein